MSKTPGLFETYDRQRRKPKDQPPIVAKPAAFRAPETDDETRLAHAFDRLDIDALERFTAEVRAHDPVALAVNEILRPLGRGVAA